MKRIKKFFSKMIVFFTDDYLLKRKHKRILLCCAIGVIVAIGGWQIYPGKNHNPEILPANTSQQEEYAPGELLIKFKDSARAKVIAPQNTGISSVNQLNSKNRVSSIQSLIPKKEKPAALDIYKIKLPPGQDIKKLAQEYSRDPNIEYAEPNYQVEIDRTPNDPYYSSHGSWGQSYDDLWGLKKISVGSAWDMETGKSSVVVGVIDTGADRTQPDLTANIWTNPREIPGNGIDDDGNGYIDDTWGWDFYNGDNDPTDDHGHGTHCAGTIAAVTNNNLGVAGISWQSKIMPLKFLSSGGSGWTSDAIDAIYYGVANGAKILSNSWGGRSRSASLQNAINYAYSNGVVFVAAAGNSNDDTYYYSPAGLDNVLTVAATDYQDVRASWSNWGDEVDIAAPGVSILSLKASGTSMGTPVGDKYTVASGTSMATPHVSGLAALMWSLNPALTNTEVTQIIRSSADDLGSSGFDIYYGYGRINAYSALFQIKPILHPSGSLVMSASEAKIYLIDSGSKRWIPNWNIFTERYRFADVLNISSWELSQYPDGPNVPYSDGTLIESVSEQKIYVLENGDRRWVTNWSDFVNMGYSLANVYALPGSEINSYNLGTDIKSGTHPNGSLVMTNSELKAYLLDAGTKRWIPNPTIYTHQFRWENLLTISTTEVDTYPTGTNVTYPDGTLLKAINGGEIYVLEFGKRRWISAWRIFTSMGYNYNNVIEVSTDELNQYVLGDNIGQ